MNLRSPATDLVSVRQSDGRVGFSYAMKTPVTLYPPPTPAPDITIFLGRDLSH
ncbi:MAG TPA: hypothetical protein VE778_01830 [Candidatus Bathyarchaeia archaeon]|nr:hypothetical protein [Candidatus Bathyarchaeia archaeon]